MMSNMSYCRWENTSHDMQDCVNSMELFDEPIGAELDGTVFDAMSHHEKSGFYRALQLAAQMLEYATAEQLAEADVNLRRLA
jgi:hypothetical protein